MKRGPILTTAMEAGAIQLNNGTYRLTQPDDKPILGLLGEEDLIEQYLERENYLNLGTLRDRIEWYIATNLTDSGVWVGSVDGILCVIAGEASL